MNTTRETPLNPHLQGLGPSATLAMNEATRKLVADGRTVYRLGFGQSPFPVPDSVAAALRSHAGEKDYLPVRGLRELREAVADWHRRTLGIDAIADDVLVGPGSKELIFLTQLACDADLIVPAPSWVSYAPQARLLGRRVDWIPTRRTDGWRLQPDDLARVCRADRSRARLLILNYPSNPTGLTYSGAELSELARVAREEQVIVLADEIYGGVHHTGAHESLARHYPEGTIVSGGLSKWCGAGGWRLGTLVIPRAMRELGDAVASAASETYSAASAPIQHAAVTAYLGGPEIDDYLQQSRRIIRALGRWVGRRLRAAGIDVELPAGGFYVFPDFTAFTDRLHARGVQTSAQLCDRLLAEAGVALLPGSDFGRPAAELTCRLAFVDFDGGAALMAARAVALEHELNEDFLADGCRPVVDAIGHLVAWLQAAR